MRTQPLTSLPLSFAGEGHVVTARRADFNASQAPACAASALTLAACSQVELKTGETYRGTLVEAEDNWNSQMKDITVTGRVRTTCRPASRVPGMWQPGLAWAARNNKHKRVLCARQGHAAAPFSLKRQAAAPAVRASRLTRRAFAQDGRVTELENVFIRGSKIRCVRLRAALRLCVF